MEAAFFDLDKTVIARASMVAFGRTFYREGLLSRRLLLRALYGQLVYLYLGADEARLERMRDSVLELTKGWEQKRVRKIVRETLAEVIEPIVFDEALALIRQHRCDGRMVLLVSTSPEEVVAPLAAYLGIREVIATRAQIDEHGRYAGTVAFYAYGQHKANAMREIAALYDIDLSRSWAYSDSATDLPMLDAVGYPVAVNPDKELLRLAQQRDWTIRTFTKPVQLRRRIPAPSVAPLTAIGSGLALAAGVAMWWWLHRGGPSRKRQTNRRHRWRVTRQLPVGRHHGRTTPRVVVYRPRPPG